MAEVLVSLENIIKRFDDVVAVNNVSFQVERGTTFALLGTSGSGKTTCLKMINGLINPTSGKVKVFGKDIKAFSPIALRRQIGYVIQRGGLFPHWTVRDNVGLVPKMLGWKVDKIDRRSDELLDLVGLPAEEFRYRYPSELSGGQQQRVGIARALAADPDLILLDEPFSALDPITRKQLQEEFMELKNKLGKTVVLVTHDVHEAMRLADRVLLMDEGKAMQQGSPGDLVDSPANDFVRSFMESQLQ